MNRFFNPDNPVLSFLGKLLDCIILNALWFVTSIPLITIGSSTSALYYCTLKLSRESGSSVIGEFFHSFKTNLKSGAKLSVILIPCGIAIALAGRFYRRALLPLPLVALGCGLCLLFAVIYLIEILYVFPLLARFENTTVAMLKNAFVVGIRFPLCTVMMAVIHIAIFYIGYKYFFPIFFLGEGFCAFLCSYLLKPVFALLEAGSLHKEKEL